MRNFKKHIQEGIGKNTGRRDLSRHRKMPKNEGYAALGRTDEHLGSYRGFLHHMINAMPEINRMAEHSMNNGAASLHPEDEKYFQDRTALNASTGLPDQTHVGTITFNHILHPDDTASEGGKFKHAKVHVIKSNNHFARGASHPIHARDRETNTLHTVISLNPQRMFHGGRRGQRTVAHEIAHSLQHAIGAYDLQIKTGSVRRGTDSTHPRLPSWLGSDSDANHDREAPTSITPSQKRVLTKVRNKIRKIGQKNTMSRYLHSGNETQARIMGYLPEIMDVVKKHHTASDTYTSIENSVNSIKYQSKNFKSPQAAQHFVHSSLSKLLDDHTKDFSKLLGRQTRGPADEDLLLRGHELPQSKPVQNRRDQLVAKQSKNMILLAHHANEHYVNDIIHHHSGHNVLQTRENPDQLSHETQREIRVQEKTKKRSQEVKPEVKPEIKPQVKPEAPVQQPKKSVFTRFKSFIGLK